jgi:hypothetical protein
MMKQTYDRLLPMLLAARPGNLFTGMFDGVQMRSSASRHNFL